MSNNRLLAAVVKKFVPEIVTLVPDTPTDGVKDVIVGVAAAATVKDDELESDPAGAVTLIDPVDAPLGTVTTSWVVVAAETAAAVPLKATEF